MNQQDREQHAITLLQNPLFIEVTGQLKEFAIAKLLSANVTNTTELQAAVLQLQAAHTHKVAFERFAQLGEHEARKASKQPEKTGFFNKFRN
ncbi:MAG: hypothetical protein ACRCV9_13845 [Burkholderiaceae bacterium]